MLSSSFRLLRLSSTTIPRRTYSVLTTNETAQPEAQKSSSIEDYLTQLAGSSDPISSPIPPSQSTSRAEPEVIKIPAILKPTHRIHVATLTITAYNPEKEHLPLVAGFALQAAYHLGIPVTRPAAMPIKTELHTVLRSGFVHKKSQENFGEVINRWVNYLKTDAVKGTNLALKVQRFLYRPVGWEEIIATGSQLDSTLTKPELTMAESAEAHDALLASTGTKDGKKMAELQVKDSEKQHTEN
ncbi:hypothetical protein KEM48_007088 [Puccinia striiformis f. sp. tritici PST-130]|nr:hypothetical protein KEM48_007088 [Puccinia striiformis f. sp. tritici PST-130]